ncbi:helix-turn-helix domain-containing protein [Enterococcus faecalis]|uniref:helix-turn-helix domain-containing protein n=1 Tax=Enterococcus faecalis TaxID=1351 RepID=UPI003A918A52
MGCSRFVYNHFLNLWNHKYTTTGKGLSYHPYSAMLPQMKRNSKTIWLKEVDSVFNHH